MNRIRSAAIGTLPVAAQDQLQKTTLEHEVLASAICRISYSIEEGQDSRYDTPQNTHLLPLVIDTAKTAEYLSCYVGVILDRHPATPATTHGER